MDKLCYRCSMHGIKTPAAEMHHVFNGAMRKKSEKYGAVIPLCRECHNIYHTNAKEYQRLKASFQRKIMIDKDLTVEEFREIFKKSYI